MGAGVRSSILVIVVKADFLEEVSALTYAGYQALKEQEEQLPGLRKPTASAKALRWKRAQHQASYGKPDGVLNQFSPRSHSSLETETCLLHSQLCHSHTHHSVSQASVSLPAPGRGSKVPLNSFHRVILSEFPTPAGNPPLR